MIDVFGGMPGALKFFLAFLVVLGLIAATAWLVRRFGGARLGVSTARGRQPRLAVVDGAPVDARRRLILIRRDNVEHLLMIGGPTDVVVEQNIIRGVAATSRDTGRAAANGGDTLPRSLPVADSWSAPPEPELPARAPRVTGPAVPEDAPARGAEPIFEPGPRAVPASDGHPAPEFPPQRRSFGRDLDLGLSRPAPSVGPVAAAPAIEPPRTEPAGETPRTEAPRVETMRFDAPRLDVPRPSPRGELRDVLRNASARESARSEPPREPPRVEPAREPARAEESRPAPQAADAEPAPAAPAAPAPPVPPAAPASTLSAAADQNLAEMAQRLEAALRRPGPGGEPRPLERGAASAHAKPAAPTAASAGMTDPLSAFRGARPIPPAPPAPTPPAPPAAAPAPAAAAAAPAAPVPDSKTPRPDAKPQGKTLYDSLEQEMASLLSRPAGKS